jgi:hypothetical protein
MAHGHQAGRGGSSNNRKLLRLRVALWEESDAWAEPLSATVVVISDALRCPRSRAKRSIQHQVLETIFLVP